MKGRDWGSLPGDVLRLIAEKFDSIEDYVRYSAVCRGWHSCCPLKSNNKPKFVPWLMLPEKQDSDMRGFYNWSTHKVLEIELPEIRGRRCWGSPFGWLITIGLDLQIHLFNPLSRARLELPPQSTFINQYAPSLSNEDLRNFFFHRILISPNPTSTSTSNSSGFIALAIYQFYMLAVAKPGDDAWRPIQGGNGWDDIICFDGNFFAVRNMGNLCICQDLCGDHPLAVEFAATPPAKFASKKYLVDLGGHLCMACRSNVEITYDDTDEDKVYYWTDAFEVFKLDMHTRNWEPVSSLGDWCLFLGNNYSFSMRASHHSGCSSNCIYFTDDYEEYLNYTLGSDMGIFNYKNKEVDYFEELPDMESSFSPPLWITPCLQ